jgi:hypothetical protein
MPFVGVDSCRVILPDARVQTNVHDDGWPERLEWVASMDASLAMAAIRAERMRRA